MGILDDAIKEHLELKRQHGADASELKQLEDEAFGAAERPGAEATAPDPLAEAPTEFMSRPDAEQEAPVAEASAPAAEQGSRPSPRAEIADLQEAPPSTAEESAAEPEPPAEEEAPAMEHEAVPEPEVSAGPTTEEREAIAEQPTEMYDLEEELASSEAPAPSEEDLVEEEMEEPRLAPVDPLSGLDETDGEVEVEAAGADEDEYEEDDDFWDEKRLSDELDQALEAPSDSEDEDAVFEEAAPPEAEQADDPEPERSRPAGNEEDVLEETPDFLEETPEDDQLWFEQKPPKDFDFDD
jgi:hypothetical protein